jgi:hypothetical protein
MFSGSTIWKGVVYSILMIIAKGFVSTVFYIEYFLKIWKNKKPLRKWRTKKNPTLPGSQNPGPQNIRLNTLATTNSNPESAPDAELSTGPPHSMALLAGLAMVARGEIGFLIASLSQSSGTLTFGRRNPLGIPSSGEEIFLVIVWAVVICTIVGPLGVGIIVRRLRA